MHSDTPLILPRYKINNIVLLIDMDISSMKCTLLMSRMDEKYPEETEKIMKILMDTRKYIYQF